MAIKQKIKRRTNWKDLASGGNYHIPHISNSCLEVLRQYYHKKNRN